MRRSDREITDNSAIEAFIQKEQIIRIAFYDEGDIYIVPVNYGFCKEGDSYTFFFHGARAGRKYELAGASPKVGFEIDGRYELLEADVVEADYIANATESGYSNQNVENFMKKIMKTESGKRILKSVFAQMKF